MLHKLLAFILVLGSAFAARAESTGGDRPYEISFEGASFLPYGISRVREVLKGVDVRGSIPTSKGKFEIDAFLANAEGITYRTFSIDYRYDLGLDYLQAFVLTGFNADFYTPAAPYDDQRYSGGWHFGGGFLQPIAGGWSVREDFRYRLGPGTTLIVGLGFNYQFSN